MAASSRTARARRSGPTPRCGRSTSVAEGGATVLEVPVLEVENVHTYCGASHVLQGISLRVAEGEVLTILGRNGMGKTTLIRSIIGFSPPRRGAVRFRGTEVTRWPSYRMVAAGMALVPQGRRGFPSLSVRENLEVAAGRAGAGEVEPGLPPLPPP